MVNREVEVAERTVLPYSLAFFVVSRERDLSGTSGTYDDKVKEGVIVCKYPQRLVVNEVSIYIYIYIMICRLSFRDIYIFKYKWKNDSILIPPTRKLCCHNFFLVDLILRRWLPSHTLLVSVLCVLKRDVHLWGLVCALSGRVWPFRRRAGKSASNRILIDLPKKILVGEAASASWLWFPCDLPLIGGLSRGIR